MKLNAVNFDGVFNNLKVFQEAQPTPNQMMLQKGGQGAMQGVTGSSIGGLQFGGIGGGGGNDMGNLI